MDYEGALHIFKFVFEAYDFVYARDCIHATEIAAHIQEDSATAYFMKRALLQGVPLSFFGEHNKLSEFRTSTLWAQVQTEAPELRAKYLASIRTDLREEVNAMFLEDQAIRTRYYKWYNFLLRPFIHKKWKELNRKQVERLIEITERYGFPGERLIGVDPPDLHPNISPKQFSAGAPIVLFIHHYSQPNELAYELLTQELSKGNLYNEHYATICDFQAYFSRSKQTVHTTFGYRFFEEVRNEPRTRAERDRIGLLQPLEMGDWKRSKIVTPFFASLY